MDTRAGFAQDGHHRPQKTLTSAWRKRGRHGRNHTDRRPSSLRDTVQAFEGIETRMFVRPRIVNQSKYTMKSKQSRFVFSILRSFVRLANLRGEVPKRKQPSAPTRYINPQKRAGVYRFNSTCLVSRIIVQVVFWADFTCTVTAFTRT
jgi:hypothetical protein